MKRTRKLLNPMCKCCVCACVCVWERGNNIVLFFGCANKINPLYFYYSFILVVICNSCILYVIHSGLKIIIFQYQHSIKHSFIFVLSMYYSISNLSCYISNYLVKISLFIYFVHQFYITKVHITLVIIPLFKFWLHSKIFLATILVQTL